MQPHLEIRRIRPTMYVYSIRIANAEPRLHEGAFRTMAQCLLDAGRSLGHYFPMVRISVDEHFLGSYAIDHLVSGAGITANELLGKVQAQQVRRAA